MGKSNRRNFLRKVVTGAASAGLIGMTLDSKALLKPVDDKSPKEGKLIFRTLGRTGIKVPVVSMGVMNSDVPELIKESYKLGIRHFDTAWIYQQGNNEKMVGQAIKEIGANRNEFIIATKIIIKASSTSLVMNKESKELFLKRFAESLERLQMDYVDILYYHDVKDKEMANNPYIIEALAELKNKNQVRFTGISTHVDWPDILNTVAEKGFYDVALISYNYSMNGAQSYIDAMKNAVSKGMGLVAMKTQCQQSWYRDNLPGELKRFYEGQIRHTALLKWALNNECITTAIPGYTTFQQMEENFSVATNLEYSKEEKEFLENRNVKLALLGNCQMCGHCIKSCPNNADIPNLMRTHMYATSYGDGYKAKETLQSISSDQSLDKCKNCDSCIAQCIRKVKIAKKISELKILYG
jgi:uncharacterized protein